MKPIITYYGGKQRMARHIVPLIPPHIVYCEPFAGSAAVLFEKPIPESNPTSYQEVLNDLNGDLISMYWKAKTNPEFAKVVRACPFSEYWWNWANVVLLSSRGDRLSRAVAKYVSHRQGFNNEALSSWARATNGVKRPYTWTNRQEDLRSRCSRIQNCALDSLDVVACIEKWDSPHTFFYVDPPYLGTQLGGMGQWGPQDLERLTRTLNMTKGSFMVSGYDDHGKYLRGSVRKEFATHCCASNSPDRKERSRTEIVWMRGPAAVARPQDVAIMQRQTCFTGPLLGPCPLPLTK